MHNAACSNAFLMVAVGFKRRPSFGSRYSMVASTLWERQLQIAVYLKACLDWPAVVALSMQASAFPLAIHK